MQRLLNVRRALQLCRYDPDPYDMEQPCKLLVSCEACPYWDEARGCREDDLTEDTLQLLAELERFKKAGGDLISRSALIERVHRFYEKGQVDLSYYIIAKEAAQMEPGVEFGGKEGE